MAKAGEIKGIRSKRSLRENAPRVVDTRLTEFLSWREDALADESNVEALHDMRIAAKRLRYALEMFDVCFPDAKRLLKELTQIQEDLGDIHDLDVLAIRLRGRLDTLERPLTLQAIDITAGSATRGDQMNKLRQVLYGYARNPLRLGLLALIGDKAVERSRRYEEFRSRWTVERLDAFAVEIRQAVGLADPPSADKELPMAQEVEGSTE